MAYFCADNDFRILNETDVSKTFILPNMRDLEFKYELAYLGPYQTSMMETSCEKKLIAIRKKAPSYSR